MARFDIVPQRRLGQHFVVDPPTVRRIARLSGAGSGDHVLEIGAGLGSLTLALAETGAGVRAVEVDARCVAALRHVLSEREVGLHSVQIVQADARRLDLAVALAGAERWMLVANLPYNIATPLVLDLLRDASAIETMVVMVQRETAERLVAPAGSRARGIPSVLVERRATARIAETVAPAAFYPRPGVESAVVRIDRRPPAHSRPLPGPVEARFACLLRAGFGQRRKMLRRSLSGMVSSEGFESAGVDPTSRAEAVTLEQWLDLAAQPHESAAGVQRSRGSAGR